MSAIEKYINEQKELTEEGKGEDDEGEMLEYRYVRQPKGKKGTRTKLYLKLMPKK